MTASTEAPYSLTVKTDGDLLTVRGTSPDEFKTNIQGLVESGALDYVRALQGHAKGNPAAVVQQVIPEAQVVQEVQQVQAQQGPPPEWAGVQQPPAVQPGPSFAPQQYQQPAQPAPQSYGQPSATPQCVHGPRTFKSGVNKQGKPWQAWFCPSPKGTPNQCEPEWIR